MFNSMRSENLERGSGIMQNKYHHVGFFARLSAWIIDWILVGLLVGVVYIILGITGSLSADFWMSQNIWFHFSVRDILIYLLCHAYFILLTYLHGQTLGKKCMSICVIRSDGNKLSFFDVLYRETVGRYLSGILMCAGYMIVLLDEEKRGFHDRLTDTRVVYEF